MIIAKIDNFDRLVFQTSNTTEEYAISQWLQTNFPDKDSNKVMVLSGDSSDKIIQGKVQDEG